MSVHRPIYFTDVVPNTDLGSFPIHILSVCKNGGGRLDTFNTSNVSREGGGNLD